MMFVKARLKKLWKGVKHTMEQFVDTAREILTGKNSRFVAACIFGGISVGLFASCYIPQPN